VSSKLAAAAAALVFVSGCGPQPERLQLQGRMLTVFNDSDRAWRSVEIWVNDYYRVTRDTIAPGERFQVPLNSFVAGFGQRFPPRQNVTGVEVTATDSTGDAVRLVLGNGRRR
jgi:hypothetical protein